MSKLTFQEVMAELKKMGTAQNIKIYKRHGAGDNLFGVSFANLNVLKKKIKKDQDIAAQLWATGNTDARSLATMVADPAQMDEETLDDWLKDISYYMLADIFAGNIVSKTAFAKKKMETWTRSDDEWIGRAGWQLLAHLAMKDESLKNEDFEPYLDIIEKNIHSSKNRIREAMNRALIAIGMRNEELEARAMAAAAVIGKVDVDHGETGCKTPDAIAYIKKAKNRKSPRRGRS